jgi:small conductance mechanosensitive channel
MPILEELGTEIKIIILKYGIEIILAIVTLFLGFRIISYIDKFFKKALIKANIDISLHAFLRGILKGTLKIALIISICGMLGIQMTSFLAILGGAGLAIGLALQGSLSNFAGGVLILILKPFKVDDYIDASGVSGTVKKIELFNTILLTPDNKTIYVPNGILSNNTITNFSVQDKRRIDIIAGISYNDDIQKAKSVLQEIARTEEMVINDPEPLVAVSSLGDSSVNLVLRVWTLRDNYWPLTFKLNERVKLDFDKNGISIPFPQRDIHLYSENK